MNFISGETGRPIDIEHLCEALKDDIGNKFRQQATEIYGPELGKSHVDQYLKVKVESELSFMKAVDATYERWSKEANPVVFWDLDETMGVEYEIADEEFKWFNRPSIETLVEYLQLKYPSVKNGILSAASPDYIKGVLNQSTQLSNFISQNIIFSVDEMDERIAVDVVAERLETEYKNRTTHAINLEAAEALKIRTLRDLATKGINCKIIDDKQASSFMEDAGLSVGEFVPRI